MKVKKWNDGAFTSTCKIDNHIIDLEYKCTSVIKIWYQYNNNMDKTFIFYDLKDKKFTCNNIDNLFTDRQKKILYKHLKNFSKNIIIDFINNIYDNNFTLTDKNIIDIENIKNKLAII